MTKGILLIDGNNLGNAANAGNSMSVGDEPTQAIYGFLRSIRPTIALYGSLMTPIVLWDGRSWRYDYFPEYKIARSKSAVTANDMKVQLARVEYAAQLPHLKTGLRLLGVRQMVANNLEADDLAGMLVERYAGKKRILMISGDKDWIQLIGPGVGWLDPINDRKITQTNIEAKLGVKSAAAWLDVKCLMGDLSDGIPGVGGIGEIGAKHLVNTYGSVANFTNQVMMKEIDIEAMDKKYRDFALQEERQIAFMRNRVLMDLRSDATPKPEALTITHEPIDKIGFKAFCQRFLFQSILKDFDTWTQMFEKEQEDGTA